MTKKIRKPVFISWTKENGRSSDLAKALGAELVHIYPRGGLIKRYFVSTLQSRRIVASLHPEQGAFFMLPPAPLALVARLARGRHHVRNFYDLHTGFFYDPKWKWASSWTLRSFRGATAIVTNSNLAALCDQAGVRSKILHDVLEPLDNQNIAGPYIVCPVSYSNDEPIDKILEAAGNLPSTRWLLTGRAPNTVQMKAPSNVEFSGFLSDADYDDALRSASLVLALTNRRDTMQRAGYEALMRGIPVVTSDFEVLRDFFEDSAVYVAEGESDLEQQVLVALEERASLAARCEEVLARRIAEQQVELAALREMLDERPFTGKGN